MKEWKRSSGRRTGGFDWFSYVAAGPRATTSSSTVVFDCRPNRDIGLERHLLASADGTGRRECIVGLGEQAFCSEREDVALENDLVIGGRAVLAAESLIHVRQVLEAARRIEGSIVKASLVMAYTMVVINLRLDSSKLEKYMA